MLAGVASLAVGGGLPARALHLTGALATLGPIPFVWGFGEERWPHIQEAARQALTAEDAAIALEHGLAMTLEQAIDDALTILASDLAWIIHGVAPRGPGSYGRGVQHLTSAWRTPCQPSVPHRRMSLLPRRP